MAPCLRRRSVCPCALTTPLLQPCWWMPRCLMGRLHSRLHPTLQRRVGEVGSTLLWPAQHRRPKHRCRLSPSHTSTSTSSLIHRPPSPWQQLTPSPPRPPPHSLPRDLMSPPSPTPKGATSTWRSPKATRQRRRATTGRAPASGTRRTARGSYSRGSSSSSNSSSNRGRWGWGAQGGAVAGCLGRGRSTWAGLWLRWQERWASSTSTSTSSSSISSSSSTNSSCYTISSSSRVSADLCYPHPRLLLLRHLCF